MKRVSSFILLFLVICAVVFPFSAAAETPSALVDDADILSTGEYTELSKRLEDLRSTYNVDVAFVIADEITGTDAQSEADDIYDYNGYGVGETYDGILYFVCETTHEYAFSTCGSGIKIFNDDGLEYIDNAMLPYLKKGDYYQAVSVYAEKCEELINMAANGQPYKKKINILYVIAGIILIPLALAFALMTHKLSKMNTAVMQTGAAQYMKPDSMDISNSRDIFLYSTVTKREKPKDSTTHTSSSGRTHGGRSGSF